MTGDPIQPAQIVLTLFGASLVRIPAPPSLSPSRIRATDHGGINEPEAMWPRPIAHGESFLAQPGA